MAKKATARVKAATTQPCLITTRKTTDKALRQAVRAIPGFPDLKVHQWMPTLMAQCRLREKPKKTERVYRVAYDCCKNARVRSAKKKALAAAQAMTMEVAQPGQEQPDGAVSVGDV